MLVFVAPWGLNSNWWEYQIPYLVNKGYRCIAYDRRGHGRSEQPSRGYDFTTLADDLSVIIKKLNLKDVVLVGHSMGCAEVVRYMSSKDSDRISKMVLIATITPFILKSPDNPDGAEPTALERGREAMSKDRPHQIAQAATVFFGAPKNNISQEIMDWWTHMMVEQCTMKVRLDLYKEFTATDFREDLRKIKIPVLLIHGDSDKSARFETTSRKTAALIAGSQLKIYEGAAHGLPITHQDQLNNDLADFSKS